jgi:ligand-binding sensor domain-containing protein
LAERVDGQVWVANGTQGVWALPDSDAPPPRQPKLPGPGQIGPLLFDHDGSLWIGTRDGVLRATDPDRLPPPDADGAPQPVSRVTLHPRRWPERGCGPRHI